MPQLHRIAAPGAAPRAGATRRRPRDLRRPALTLLLGFALLGTTVRPAHATAGFYTECVATVTSLTQACVDSAGSFLGQAACATAGGIGVLACAAAEAARLLATGIRVPNAT
jgi:hypothetical protein